MSHSSRCPRCSTSTSHLTKSVFQAQSHERQANHKIRLSDPDHVRRCQARTFMSLLNVDYLTNHHHSSPSYLTSEWLVRHWQLHKVRLVHRCFRRRVHWSKNYCMESSTCTSQQHSVLSRRLSGSMTLLRQNK